MEDNLSVTKEFPYSFLENLEKRESCFFPIFSQKIKWFIKGQIKPFFLVIHRNSTDNIVIREMIAEKLYQVIISAIKKTHGKINSAFLTESETKDIELILSKIDIRDCIPMKSDYPYNKSDLSNDDFFIEQYNALLKRIKSFLIGYNRLIELTFENILLDDYRAERVMDESEIRHDTIEALSGFMDLHNCVSSYGNDASINNSVEAVSILEYLRYTAIPERINYIKAIDTPGNKAAIIRLNSLLQTINGDTHEFYSNNPWKHVPCFSSKEKIYIPQMHVLKKGQHYVSEIISHKIIAMERKNINAVDILRKLGCITHWSIDDRRAYVVFPDFIGFLDVYDKAFMSDWKCFDMMTHFEYDD